MILVESAGFIGEIYLIFITSEVMYRSSIQKSYLSLKMLLQIT